MTSKLKDMLKLPNKLFVIYAIYNLKKIIEDNLNTCYQCNQKIDSIPILSKNKQSSPCYYHINCAYQINLLTDRQYFLIKKLPIMKLSIEKVTNELEL